MEKGINIPQKFIDDARWLLSVRHEFKLINKHHNMRRELHILKINKKTNEAVKKYVYNIVHANSLYKFDGTKPLFDTDTDTYKYDSGLVSDIISFDENAMDAFSSFFILTQKSKKTHLSILKDNPYFTKHPNVLKTLLEIKSSVYLHIKGYADALNHGGISFEDVDDLCERLNAPNWFKDGIFKLSVYERY